MEIKQLITNKGWVSADGSWGIGEIAVFDENALTDDQWDKLDEMSDNDKFDYVVAVLNGNDPDLLGECDTCGETYDVSSRDGRCGDCGECKNHCEHAEATDN
jgi:hypothetical protein